MTILFSNSSPKIHNSDIFGPKFRHFFFRETLQIDKFEGTDFKYDNSFFKILAQKYPVKVFLVKNTQKQHFWSQIQTFLFLHKILQLDKFENVGFKYDNSSLKFQPENTQIRHFWSRTQVFLFFRKMLQVDKFEGADFKYDNSFSKIFAQKYPNKKAFLVKTTQIMHF